MSEPLVLTVEEAARLLRIGRGSAYEAVRNGDMPSVRLGRRILVPRARLLALLGELPANGDGEGGEYSEEANSPGATATSVTRRGDVSMTLEP